jgi:RNA polymerase sigma-70 factor (ECF subfamily)
MAVAQHGGVADVVDAAAGGSPSDHSLLRRFRDGDPDAADHLYRRYAVRVHALARKRCLPHLAPGFDADDVAQSVFVTFFRKARAGAYDVPPGEDLWKLFLVMTLNEVRSRVAFHQAAKRDARLTRGMPADDPGRLREPHSHDFTFTFMQLCVREACERMPETHRTVMELRLCGYEVGEIAERTGRPRRTVERILKTAREHLSHHLDENTHHGRADDRVARFRR